MKLVDDIENSRHRVLRDDNSSGIRICDFAYRMPTVRIETVSVDYVLRLALGCGGGRGDQFRIFLLRALPVSTREAVSDVPGLLPMSLGNACFVGTYDGPDPDRKCTYKKNISRKSGNTSTYAARIVLAGFSSRACQDQKNGTEYCGKNRICRKMLAEVAQAVNKDRQNAKSEPVRS